LRTVGVHAIVVVLAAALVVGAAVVTAAVFTVADLRSLPDVVTANRLDPVYRLALVVTNATSSNPVGAVDAVFFAAIAILSEVHDPVAAGARLTVFDAASSAEPFGLCAHLALALGVRGADFTFALSARTTAIDRRLVLVEFSVPTEIPREVSADLAVSARLAAGRGGRLAPGARLAPGTRLASVGFAAIAFIGTAPARGAPTTRGEQRSKQETAQQSAKRFPHTQTLPVEN
jgi:hypothetical protein